MTKNRVLAGAGLCGTLCAVLFAATLQKGIARGTASAKPTAAASTSAGKSVRGLQLSLVQISGAPSKPEPESLERLDAQLEVTLRNVGKRDVLLSLGDMLGNGREQIPSQIRFVLVDAAGKKDTFSFYNGRPGFRGRMDEYRVPLRVGSTYGLKFKLNELWLSKTQSLVSKLKPGKYQVFAQFEGVSEKARNWGQKDIGLMNYWKGNCQSNTVTLEK